MNLFIWNIEITILTCNKRGALSVNITQMKDILTMYDFRFSVDQTSNGKTPGR